MKDKMKYLVKPTAICDRQPKTFHTEKLTVLPVFLSPVNPYSSFVSRLSPLSRDIFPKLGHTPPLQAFTAHMLSCIPHNHNQNFIVFVSGIIYISFHLQTVDSIKAGNKFDFVHHWVSTAQHRILSPFLLNKYLQNEYKLHKKYCSQRTLFSKIIFSLITLILKKNLCLGKNRLTHFELFLCMV